MSLLIDSYIFSILFSMFLIIFTINILNSFSGNFLISSSFIWTSVFLLCSFICAVFLCFFIFFLSYCVWGLLFPGFKKNWILSLKKIGFFLPFGFCPAKVGPVVCVRSCRVRVVLSFFLFVCFSSDGQGWVRWWSCLLMIGFVFLFCWLDEASCTGCYWGLDDARSCIQVVSFVWVLTIWYSLGLVLWYSRVLELVLPLQRLRVCSLVRNEHFTSGLLWH